MTEIHVVEFCNNVPRSVRLVLKHGYQDMAIYYSMSFWDQIFPWQFTGRF